MKLREAWGCNSLLKCLPNTGKVLDSIPTPNTKNKNKSINKGTFHFGTQLLSRLFIEQEASIFGLFSDNNNNIYCVSRTLLFQNNFPMHDLM